MTNNQIQYQRHLEDQRSNLAREALTDRDLSERERHNLESERYSWADLGERTRHNKAGESISWSDLAERSRHNKVSEQYGWADLAERSRYHDDSLGVERDKLAEQHRSNFAQEIAKYLLIGKGKGVLAHPEFRDYVAAKGKDISAGYDLLEQASQWFVDNATSTGDLFDMFWENGDYESAWDILHGQ